MPTEPNDFFDAVIVGGGPAGAVAGAYLARSGIRPLIVEKETFPRFAIGESLLPCGNDILKDLGVWPELERGGFLKKYGADFTSGHAKRFNRYWFRSALGKDYEHTYQVERSAFDQILLDAARREGCEVLEAARVAEITSDANGHPISVIERSNEKRTIRVPLVDRRQWPCGRGRTSVEYSKNAHTQPQDGCALRPLLGGPPEQRRSCRAHSDRALQGGLVLVYPAIL
jgi:hypothetical protein